MPAPPFEPQGSDRDLLSGVRAVAEHQRAARPTALTMREFDDGREPAGRPDLPTARAICQRLRLGWREVLAAACGAPGRELANAAQRATGGSRHGLDVDDAVLAIRRAAVRLGVRSLTRTAYTEARGLIIAASPAGGRPATAAPMPDINQLDGLLRRAELSWSALCTRAGLDRPALRRSVGLTAEQALALFTDTMQAVPRTGPQLRGWCRHHGLATARWPGGTYPDAIRAHAQRRADAGLPPLPAGAPAEYGQAPADPDGTLPRRRQGRWDRQSLIDGLARAIAARPAGRALRRTSLAPLAIQDPAIPHAGAVARWLKHHPDDSWNRLLDEAEALARATRGNS